MKRMNFPGRRKLRREEAQERAEARGKRSPQKQLARLDRLFGEGKGAARERARLAAEIEKAAAAEKKAAKEKDDGGK